MTLLVRKVIRMNLSRYIYLSLLVVLIICSAAANIHAADVGEADVHQFMSAYFRALKDGDVNTLLNMLGEPLLDSRRILLEKNTAYPDHLRAYYRDADFAVRTITSPKAGVYAVTAEFIFEAGSNSAQSKFFLEQVNGQFKIYREVKDD